MIKGGGSAFPVEHATRYGADVEVPGKNRRGCGGGFSSEISLAFVFWKTRPCLCNIPIHAIASSGLGFFDGFNLFRSQKGIFPL